MRSRPFPHRRLCACVAALAACVLAGCARAPDHVLTFSGSALGREGELVRAQLARFAALHPDLPVELRTTPDAADERHQLYVQWLNARAADPDVLQLDVIWTAEFAAAGWILPLDSYQPGTESFYPAAIAANRWRGALYALPWFVDVGMLYWRTDLMPRAPATFDELRESVRRARRSNPQMHGLVWQGARYEGLVTVFVEHLGAFGGRILDDDGKVVVDSPRAVAALTAMRDAIHAEGTVPAAVLTWQEEQTRFAFQNGQAVLMRNWPYALPLASDPDASAVAGRVGIAPMPSAAGGVPTAALGGAQLAINARTRQPAAAYALIAFLTAPEQMRERARVVGQYPSRRELYDEQALGDALGAPAAAVRDIIDRAVPRPVTPIYTELSGILQLHLHRALSRQEEPGPALQQAAAQITSLLARTGLGRATEGERR